MITRELANKIDSLKLSSMKPHFESVMKKHEVELNKVSAAFEELAELQMQQNNVDTQIRYRKAANLRWPHASISNIDYRRQKPLTKKDAERLAEGHWVKEHCHLLLIGPTGAAKTTLACAFANELIARGYRVSFYRFNDLLLELKSADNNPDRKVYQRLIKKLVKVPVLILDDWGISQMGADQRRLLFDLIEQREDSGSLIITSQYQPCEWHTAFGDVTMADAILDRIVHSAHVFDFKKVESFRKIKALKGGIDNVKH
jgi:DNA replication protein DnaC